ncbi:MAG: hypothetical protein ACI9JL_003811 [Paracoccaceae bacterium]|jgi:hypothetical protein
MQNNPMHPKGGQYQNTKNNPIHPNGRYTGFRKSEYRAPILSIRTQEQSSPHSPPRHRSRPPWTAGTRSGRRTGVAAACPVPRIRKKPVTLNNEIRTEAGVFWHTRCTDNAKLTIPKHVRVTPDHVSLLDERLNPGQYRKRISDGVSSVSSQERTFTTPRFSRR